MELEKLYEYERYGTLYRTLENSIDVLNSMIVTVQQDGYVVINHFQIRDKESVNKILSGMRQSLYKFDTERLKVLQEIHNL